MPPLPRVTPPSRAERLFDALLARDGAGGSWLGPLLQATPHGRTRLGELAKAPGWLEAPIAVHTETGRRGAFEYPAAPSQELLGFLVDHPERLTWVDEPDASPETLRLRHALVDDEPVGVRARARDRAHELMRNRTPPRRAWWRFEEAHTVDCLLMTDRLVLVVHDAGANLEPATPWLPGRSALVRDLEAGRAFGESGKTWAVLVLADEVAAPAEDRQAVRRAVEEGAPHLDGAGAADLVDGYLGALTWAQAATVTGIYAEGTE